MSTTLSLYDLSAELVALMDAWDDPETTPEARSEIETQLRIYAEQHVRKVDNVRAYLRHCEMMAQYARVEEERQKRNKDVWQARAERLKQVCVAVMQTFQAKRLDGNTGSLLLKGNGGKQPVTITNPDLVPDEFCAVVLTIPGAEYVRLWPWLVDAGWTLATEADMQKRREPRKSLIEAELQKPCETCEGKEPFIVTCMQCGGSGKRGVSGAYLAERGVHLEVR